MSTITTLASGAILGTNPPTDRTTLAVLLVRPEGLPASVLVHWPGIGPATDLSPARFPAVALAVIAIMDQAMIALNEAGDL